MRADRFKYNYTVFLQTSASTSEVMAVGFVLNDVNLSSESQQDIREVGRGENDGARTLLAYRVEDWEQG